MSEDKKLSAVERLAARERAKAEEDAKAKAELEEQRAEQMLIDLDAFDALELEHGRGRVAKIYPPQFKQGLPAFVIVRAPTALEYKRYSDMYRRAQQDGEKQLAAGELLGKSCLAYPDEKVREEMMKTFHAMAMAAYPEAVRMAEFSSKEEKKA